MAGIRVPGPGDILVAEDISVEGKLETGIAHITDVDGDATGRVTCGKRDVLHIEHVLGNIVEVLDVTVEASAEELEVETCVEVVVSLPGDVFITLVGKTDGELLGILVVGVGVLVGIRIESLSEVVVTLLAVADLELEHIDPGCAAHKVLLADEPGAADGPEVAPAMSRSETRRSVATERGAGEILAIVIILGAAEESFGHIVVLV